jgi:DNA-binding MarR family transcriptional regulator
MNSPQKLACYCGSIRQVARVVSQIYDEAIKPADLEQTHFTVLSLLYSRPDLISGEIGKALAMDPSTITRTLRLMEQLGLIRWAPGPDRREKRWTMTTLGEERLAVAMPLWQAAQAKLRAVFGEGEIVKLQDLSFQLVSKLSSAA